MIDIFKKFHKTLCLLAFVCLLPLGAAAQDVNDPFEKVNRGIFQFNNTLDDNVFVPIAKG